MALDVGQTAIAETVREHLDHLGGQQTGFGGTKLAAGLPSTIDRRFDLAGIETYLLPIALDHAGWGTGRVRLVGHLDPRFLVRF
jgi:hypothetical protein